MNKVEHQQNLRNICKNRVKREKKKVTMRILILDIGFSNHLPKIKSIGVFSGKIWLIFIFSLKEVELGQVSWYLGVHMGDLLDMGSHCLDLIKSVR